MRRLLLASVALRAAAGCAVPDPTRDDPPDATGIDAAPIDAITVDAPPDGPPTAAQLVLDPAGPHHFDDLIAGAASPPFTYTVRNDGNLDSGPITVSVPAAVSFVIVDDTCTGVALGDHQSCTFGVEFQPRAVVAAAAELTVTATPGGPLTRTLDGTGLQPGTIAIAESSFDFGLVAVTGNAVLHVVRVDNIGSNPVQVQLVTVVGGGTVFAAHASTCSPPIPPGGHCDLTMRFDPSAVGRQTSSMGVGAYLGGSDGVDLAGTGFARVSVDHLGTGFGTVTSTEQPGITCGGTCTANFTQPQITLNALPAPGSRFTGWSDACTGTASCALALDGDKHATAHFDLAP